jgi:hypothetical protein
VADLDPHRLACARGLLAQAQQRAGWVTLKGKRPERAEALFLAADDPERGILAYDNVKMRDRLGLTQMQWQDLSRALKDARLLFTHRSYETLPNGRKRTTGPAVWNYAPTDKLHPSQIPKKRRGSSEARLQA